MFEGLYQARLEDQQGENAGHNSLLALSSEHRDGPSYNVFRDPKALEDKTVFTPDKEDGDGDGDGKGCGVQAIEVPISSTYQ